MSMTATPTTVGEYFASETENLNQDIRRTSYWLVDRVQKGTVKFWLCARCIVGILYSDFRSIEKVPAKGLAESYNFHSLVFETTDQYTSIRPNAKIVRKRK